MFLSEKLAESSHAQLYGYTFLVDMKDWKWENFSKEHADSLFQLLQFIAPVRLQTFILVDPPLWFNTVWSIISPAMTKQFKSRWFMTTRSKLPEHISEKALPPEMGGEAKMSNEFLAPANSFGGLRASSSMRSSGGLKDLSNSISSQSLSSPKSASSAKPMSSPKFIKQNTNPAFSIDKDI